MKEKRKECVCQNCQKIFPFISSSFGKYCSHRCQMIFQYKVYIDKWKKGEVSGTRGKQTISFSKHLIKYIFEKFNNTCQCCKNNTWNEKQIPLEIEHIDGNSVNNTEENLSLLCPNCHAQTSTYKGANRGHGRFARKIRYANGQSY